MNIATMIVTVLGLCLFEIVSSIDNAVINAEVLGTMDTKSRRWFLTWGFLIAVFVVRGLLPWLIVWFATPGLGPVDAFTATLSGNTQVQIAIAHAAPALLLAGSMFLLFLFFHWLYLEKKVIGLKHERFFERYSLWFFATISLILCVVVWRAMQIAPALALGAVIGSTMFFVTHGFKENAEKSEKKMLAHRTSSKEKAGGLSKILYLEIIDATFSIDGVLGAFAFTLSVPLILIGNGLGAFILRKLTVGNIERIKKYVYLKNGAMYSIFVLGIIMLSDAFGATIPAFVSPLITFIIVGYFFLKSHRALNK